MSDKKLNQSIEDVYASMRKLFNIQLHEFYRQFKEKTLNPENIVSEDSYKYLIDIIEKCESTSDDNFTIREQLDLATAEFLFAFLMKLEDDITEVIDENEENEDGL